MKKSLRRLTIAPLLGLATAALLAGGGWYALNRKTPTPVETSENAAPATKPKATVLLASDVKNRDSAGNSMLADAILSLERRPQISAQARQQAFINDLPIIGQGIYRQQGRGEQRLIKWELQSQVGDERASLVQLVDDRFLWIDQRLPSKRRVERVDLWRLRRATGIDSATRQMLDPGQAASLVGIGNFGGLPMLMESLSRNFDFAAPRQLQLATEPVYALRGTWKQQRLRELLEVTPEAGNVELPPRVPLEILVLLGSRDYFPYLIEYRSASDPILAADEPVATVYQLSQRPMLRIEFYQVSLSTPIDRNEFVFSLPEGVDWIDATARYIDRVNRYRNEQLAVEKEKKRK